jgi:diacylglycerol kinase (ATP)
MKRVHIIFNPLSGRGRLSHDIEELILGLIRLGCRVSLFETDGPNDAMQEAYKRAEAQDIDLLLSFGGDGTLREIINGLMQAPQQVPVCPFGGGTANDFASYLEIPREVRDFLRAFPGFSTHHLDLGESGGQYFINVLAAGTLANIAHRTESNLKNLLGPVAYYLEGIREVITEDLFGTIRIESESFTYLGEYLVFLLSNSSSIGGFFNMAPLADTQDGLLEGVLIKKAPLPALLEISILLQEGKHIESPYVSYFQTDHLRFWTEDELDMDGELFLESTPPEGVEVKVLQRQMPFFY